MHRSNPISTIQRLPEKSNNHCASRRSPKSTRPSAEAQPTILGESRRLPCREFQPLAPPCWSRCLRIAGGRGEGWAFGMSPHRRRTRAVVPQFHSRSIFASSALRTSALPAVSYRRSVPRPRAHRHLRRGIVPIVLELRDSSGERIVLRADHHRGKSLKSPYSHASQYAARRMPSRTFERERLRYLIQA